MSDLRPRQPALRPLELADLPLILTWRNHPDVRRHMFSTKEITLEEHRAWYESRRADSSTHLFVFEANDKAEGFLSFKEVSSGVLEWGFYKAPDAPRNSGQALGILALSWAFDGLRCRKVCGRVLSANLRSLLFHTRLGFVEEGVLRGQHSDGVGYQDVVCFGLLEPEWRSFRNSGRG